MQERFGQVLWLIAATLLGLGFYTHDDNVARFLWLLCVPFALVAFVVLPPVRKRSR